MNEDSTAASRPPPGAPEIGSVIGGRYRLDALVGRGGMATVYRAHDVVLDRPVAVKLLRPEILADPDLALRFRREAHAATVLRHPNVVACLDTGRHGDLPYLVMELVEGEDLATRLRREGALPQPEAIRIATDVARGLAVAHARGIVHRDVKPGNILLGVDGRGRVTDFGIARLAAEAEATLPGTTLGSVHYFSPEQARGVTTTPASDVYGLGLVLYEMVTGSRPFGGATPAEIALARVDAPAPSPRAVAPSVAPSLDAIVRRATAPDPADRYPNGAALAADLEALVQPADPLSQTAVVPVGSYAGAAAAPRPAAGPRPAVPRTTGPGLVVPSLAVVTILLGIAAGLGVFVLGGGPPGLAGGPSSTPVTTTAPEPEPTVTSGPTTSPVTPAPATEDPTAAPATPDPVVPPPPDGTADVCDPPPGDTCTLAPGAYVPSRLLLPIRFEIGEGWSALLHEPAIVVLARDEGFLAIVAEVAEVYDEGEPHAAPPSANRLAAEIEENRDLEVLGRGRGRIDGRRATVLDVVPTGDERVPVLGVADNTYYAEVETVTRLFVLGVGGRPVVVVLEGANGFQLEDVLVEGEAVLGSLRFE